MSLKTIDSSARLLPKSYEALMLRYLSRRGSLPLGKIESDRRAVLAEILPEGRRVAGRD